MTRNAAGQRAGMVLIVVAGYEFSFSW